MNYVDIRVNSCKIRRSKSCTVGGIWRNCVKIAAEKVTNLDEGSESWPCKLYKILKFCTLHSVSNLIPRYAVPRNSQDELRQKRDGFDTREWAKWLSGGLEGCGRGAGGFASLKWMIFQLCRIS